MTDIQKNNIVADEIILNKIYVIRRQKVMLDEDLADLYQVTTGNLNKAVARNIKRMPEDFMFRLSEEEFKILLFQNGRASWGGRRQPPNAFTEAGVAMLSGLLSSDRAIMVNIQIMRLFTQMRQLLIDNSDLRIDIEKIKNKLTNQDKNMEIIFRYLDELLDKQVHPNPPRTRIGFKPDTLV
ncbi:MAG: ORF6N domain-containing protein [Pedobacter sp.]|nr:MAG: ORF6N domain-containing protein [Pedobacter sp.]